MKNRLRKILLGLGLSALPMLAPEAFAQARFMNFGYEPPKIVVPPPRALVNRQSRTEATQCEGNCPQPTVRNNYRDLRVAGQTTIRSRSISFRNASGKEFDPKCHKFIDGNGNYGDYGVLMLEKMNQSRYYQQFLKRGALTDVCPKFDEMKDDELKMKAWVWFWMVLANEEAECDHAYYHPIWGRRKNGTRFKLNPRPGWGLFAINLRESDRYWRGSACHGNVERLEVQASCAVHTMSTLQLERGTGVLGAGNKRYWGPVIRANRQIKPNMAGFKACF